jgi:anti-anti-sigma factor
VSGQLAAAEVAEFERHLAPVQERKPAVLVIELSGLDLITSGGIGALLKLQRRLFDDGRELRLAALQPRIAEIVRLSRLDDVFDVYDSEAGALSGVRLREKS